VAKKTAVDRKPEGSEVIYIAHALESIRKEIDNIEAYLNENPWNELPEEKRNSAFRFRADLIDKKIEWVGKYAELTGLVNFFNRHTESRTAELRKGFDNSTGAQERIKQKTARRIERDK
jgi:hypothetical protein